jgi:nucleoside-diphosphate-sugar epimerase
MRIAVTGASGFIGGAIATALVADGHSVIGFGRRPSGWNGDYREWDLARTPLADTPEVDAVIHAAAVTDERAPLAVAMRANRDGTFRALVAFPGARFVHLSTSSVYDAFTPTIDAVESDGPAELFLSSYSRSKVAAEREVARVGGIILRPHAVYGPGDTTLLPRILAGVHGRHLRLPNGAHVLHTLTHIDNLLQAVRLSLAVQLEPGASRIYNVGDDAPVMLDEVLAELLTKQGRVDVTLASIPYSAAFAAAAVSERLNRVGLSRYAVSQVGLQRTLDLTAARTELGYRPAPTSLAGAEHW